MTVRTMLTTVDNPYSPFDEWDAWYQFDLASGYNTPGLLARIAKVSHEISETDLDLAISNAIDEIVNENVSGVHRKISKDVADS